MVTPFSLVIMSPLYHLTAGKCDIAIGDLSPPSFSCLYRPNFLSKHLALVTSYREGQLHAQPQPLSTRLEPSSLLSIDFCLDRGCPLSERVTVSSPWIQRSPTFCPWWKAERGAETKKNLVSDHIHDREVLAPLCFSRNRPPLLRKALS